MTAVPDLPIPPELTVDTEPFVDDELDLYLAVMAAGPDDGTGGPEVEQAAKTDRWQIDSLGAAGWAMAKVATIDAHVAEVAEQADAWAARVADWRAEQTRHLADRRAFFEHHLVDYAARRRAETGEKTLTLPSGKVTSRSSSAAAVVADEALVLAWAKANLEPDTFAEVVKVVESVRVAELRKVVHVKDDVVISGDGEVVPGIDVRPAGVSYTVTAG